MLRFGIEGQKTDIPKYEHAPDNLTDPLPGYDRVQGVFTRESSQVSFFDWAAKRPLAAQAAATVALAAVVTLGARRGFPSYSR